MVDSPHNFSSFCMSPGVGVADREPVACINYVRLNTQNLVALLTFSRTCGARSIAAFTCSFFFSRLSHLIRGGIAWRKEIVETCYKVRVLIEKHFDPLDHVRRIDTA